MNYTGGKWDPQSNSNYILIIMRVVCSRYTVTGRWLLSIRKCVMIRETTVKILTTQEKVSQTRSEVRGECECMYFNVCVFVGSIFSFWMTIFHDTNNLDLTKSNFVFSYLTFDLVKSLFFPHFLTFYLYWGFCYPKVALKLYNLIKYRISFILPNCDHKIQ